MTKQNTDARVIELHEKRQAIRAALKRAMPRSQRDRQAAYERGASVVLIDKAAIAEAYRSIRPSRPAGEGRA